MRVVDELVKLGGYDERRRVRTIITSMATSEMMLVLVIWTRRAGEDDSL